MKKIIIIILISALVIGGIGVGVGVYLNQPQTVIKMSLGSAIEDFLERDELAPMMKMLDKGSLELQMTNGADSEKIELGGKLYFSKNAFYADALKYKTVNATISGSVYVSEDYSYIYSEDFLNGKTWGIFPGGMSHAFQESVFAYDSKTAYAIPSKDAHDMIVGILDAYDNGISEEFVKDYEKVTKKYTKLFLNLIGEHGDYEAENDSVKVNGQRIDARVITLIIDGDAAVKIMEDLYEAIEDDDELRKMIIKYGDYVQEYLISSGEMKSNEDIEDLYDKMLEEFEKAVDEMDAEIDDFGELILEIATPKFSSRLMKMRLIEKIDGEKEEIFTFEVGTKGIKKSREIHLTLGGAEEYAYRITKNNSDTYEASLQYHFKTLRGETFTDTLLEIKIDRSSNKFRISLPSSSTYKNGLVIRGNFEQNKGELKISLKDIRNGEEVISSDLSLAVVLKEKDSMPNVKKCNDVANVLDITVDEINAIKERIEKLFDMK